MYGTSSRKCSESQNFYKALLGLKGVGFAVRAKKDILRVRMLAIVFIIIGIAVYCFVEGLLGPMTLVFTSCAAGACAAIDGGVSKRLRVWPYFDEVIDWTLVEEKSQQ